MYKRITETTDELLKRYITANDRAVTVNKCFYFLDDKLSPLGQCINYIHWNIDNKWNESTVQELSDHLISIGSCLDDILYDSYRGFPMEYWMRIQKIHDLDQYWNVPPGHGLSPMGHTAYLQLLQQIWD